MQATQLETIAQIACSTNKFNGNHAAKSRKTCTIVAISCINN
jgi:hypothetical protein